MRVDWNASANDKVFGRFSFSKYDEQNDKRGFPLLLGTVRTAPFRNLALNWNRVVNPSLINEVLVGYNQITIVTEALDWAGIGNANATFGIAGGQPIPGLSAIQWGSSLTNDRHRSEQHRHARQDLSDQREGHLAEGPPLREVGGQLLHYVQQRYYAGNNGALGLFGYGGTFTGFAFSDFLLDQVTNKGRGSVSAPWTHLHNRIALYVQDDFKVNPALTLNLGMRWAYTQPIVEKDNRQSNFSLTTGQQILRDGRRSREPSPLQGLHEGLRAAAWRRLAAERSVGAARRYGISQYMEGTGANLRLPLNPPFFFESDVRYDATTGGGTLVAGFSDVRPLDQPSGQVRAWDPNLRPQFTQQWNAFAEYLLTESMSANIGYVGHRATHLVTPVEGNQPLPGVGDPSTWAPLDRRRPLFATAPLITNISTTASRGRSDYNALQVRPASGPPRASSTLASYTLGRVRTNNLGYYGSGGVQAEGAYWMNAYQPEWNYGPAFFDVRHNFVLSANYELPGGRAPAPAAAERHLRRLETQRSVPGAHRLPDHGHRRPRLLAPGGARE